MKTNQIKTPDMLSDSIKTMLESADVSTLENWLLDFVAGGQTIFNENNAVTGHEAYIGSAKYFICIKGIACI